MNNNHPMKTPDYKHLGEIGANAALEMLTRRGLHNWNLSIRYGSASWYEESEGRIAFVRAVIEEQERLRMAEVGDNFPSSDKRGDWPEDFTHENGNYMCNCCECGKIFMGHKRRVACKICVGIKEGTKQAEEISRLTSELDERRHVMAMIVRRMGNGGHGLTNDEIEPAVIKLVEGLADAERRLGEIAKLPDRWKQDAGVFTWKPSMRLVEELEKALSPAPTAEEVSRAKFEKEWLAYCPDDDFTVDEKAAAWHMWQARAAKEVKAADE